jgi:DNA-binding NtrC family response regulator
VQHLLVVDDEPTIREVVKMALEADGTYRVTAVSSAIDALAVLRHDRPNGAIIDAAMPSAPDTPLANQALLLGVPVLIITGAPPVQEILSAHDIPFLAKPFRIKDVIAETRLLLSESKERHAQLAMRMARMVANLAELRDLLRQSRRHRDRREPASGDLEEDREL